MLPLAASISFAASVRRFLLLFEFHHDKLRVTFVRFGQTRTAAFPNPSVDFDAFLTAVGAANKEMVTALPHCILLLLLPHHEPFSIVILIFTCIFPCCVSVSGPGVRCADRKGRRLDRYQDVSPAIWKPEMFLHSCVSRCK